MPTVSVVMPVYNVEAYVAASIRSVLNQTFDDFELIIVDDGGSDSSVDICRAFSDCRIKVLNRGLPGARNTGIRIAQGEYIAIIDSDDVWMPDKLARHIAHFRQRPEVGVSYSASSFIDGDGKPIGLNQRPKLTNVTARDIFCRNPIGNGSVPVFRRKVLDDIAFAAQCDGGSEVWYFDEAFRYCEDVECWTRISLTTAWRFEGLADCLTQYRVVKGGLSANTSRMYEFWIKARDKAATYAPEFIALNGKRAEGYQLRYYARRAVKEGNGRLALAQIYRALSLYPFMIVEEPVRTIVTAIATVAVYLIPIRFLEKTFEMLRRPMSRRIA
jgi:glycosyltransferase involved in cell wall biosynthesis